MGRVIVISSGKGGVGKTTITANLGIILAKNNKSVCLVDGDFGLNNLDCMLNLENRVVFDIIDVLKGNCRLTQGLIKDPVFSNLYLLASLKQESNRFISKEDFKGLIADLSAVFDYVLIDSPAGIDFGFERAISPAGEMLVVVTPSVCSIRDAKKTIDKAKGLTNMEIKVVVNRFVWNMASAGEMLTHKDIENLLGEDVVGIIPENKALVLGKNIKLLYDAEQELVTSFLEFGKNLINGTNNLGIKTRGVGGFLSGIKTYFKKIG